MVYANFCSGADQIKRQSSALLAFVRGIHRWPVNSHHKGPVTRKMVPFDDVIMKRGSCPGCRICCQLVAQLGVVGIMAILSCQWRGNPQWSRYFRAPLIWNWNFMAALWNSACGVATWPNVKTQWKLLTITSQLWNSARRALSWTSDADFRGSIA